MWPQGRLSYLNPKEMRPVKSEVVFILPAPHMDASAILGEKQAPRCGGLKVQVFEQLVCSWWCHVGEGMVGKGHQRG